MIIQYNLDVLKPHQPSSSILAHALKEIRGVIGKYREEYDLTKDDIDPTLKELLDW